LAKISFSQVHQLSLVEIKAQVEELALSLMKKVGGEFRWRENSIYYTFRGVIARIDCNPSDILIDIRLGFVSSLVRGRIEQEINNALNKLMSLRKIIL